MSQEAALFLSPSSDPHRSQSPMAPLSVNAIFNAMAVASAAFATMPAANTARRISARMRVDRFIPTKIMGNLGLVARHSVTDRMFASLNGAKGMLVSFLSLSRDWPAQFELSTLVCRRSETPNRRPRWIKLRPRRPRPRTYPPTEIDRSLRWRASRKSSMYSGTAGTNGRRGKISEVGLLLR